MPIRTVINLVLSKGLIMIKSPVTKETILIIKTRIFEIEGILLLKKANNNTRPMIIAQRPIIVTNTVATNSGLDKIMVPMRIPIMPSRSKRYQCLFDLFALYEPIAIAKPPISIETAK